MAVSMQTHDLDIRPISDLRNKFSEVADLVQDGQPIIFTKNGYGYMVTMSYNAFKGIQDPVLAELKRADEKLEGDDRHYSREESLAILKRRANARRRVHA